MKINIIFSINERSLTSAETVTYTDNLMECLHASTVPTSDTVATATVLDGYTVDQGDYLGGNWSSTRNYNATGILSTQTDPRGITTSTQTDIAGRIILQSDGTGNQTISSYTACCNNLTPEFDADGNLTRLQTSTGIWTVEYKAPEGFFCLGDWRNLRSNVCPLASPQ